MLDGGDALKLELANDHWLTAEWEELAAVATEARDEAEAAGERMLLASAWAMLALGEYNLADTAAARVAVDFARSLIDAAHDYELALRLETLAALGHAELGIERFDDAERHLERGLAICRETGQANSFVWLMCMLTVAQLLHGRLPESAATSADAAVGAARLLHDEPQVWALSLRCWIQILHGDLATALEAGEEAVAVAQRVPTSLFSWMAHACMGWAEIEAASPRPAAIAS